LQPRTLVAYGKFPMTTTTTMDVEQIAEPLIQVPSFPAVKVVESSDPQYRKILVPSHRLTPLRANWMKIYTPLVEILKLQIRFNPKTRAVEIRTSEHTTESSALQKAADFVRAFTLGFDVDDAMVLLRLDDMYVDSFEVKDVKTLNGEHMSRAVGRLAGKSGKTKNTIENASRTRIVLADSKIHILGSYRNIRVAKDAIVSLIMGSTPGKVYNRLRNVAARLTERSF
jgi:RNA-binding protein PNO1